MLVINTSKLGKEAKLLIKSLKYLEAQDHDLHKAIKKLENNVMFYKIMSLNSEATSEQVDTALDKAMEITEFISFIKKSYEYEHDEQISGVNCPTQETIRRG